MRSSRATVWRLAVMSNSSAIQRIKSHRRQRTVPSTSNCGPLSTKAAKARRCRSLRSGLRPGALPLIKPSTPWALKRNTQSRTICKPTPPKRATSLRLRHHRSAIRPEDDAYRPHPYAVLLASEDHRRKSQIAMLLLVPSKTSGFKW